MDDVGTIASSPLVRLGTPYGGDTLRRKLADMT